MKLQQIVNRVKEEGERRGLKINTSKTEVTVISSRPEERQRDVRSGEEISKSVDHFKYLLSEVSQDGRCIIKIKKRIPTAKQSFNKMKTVLSSSHISV